MTTGHLLLLASFTTMVTLLAWAALILPGGDGY